MQKRMIIYLVKLFELRELLARVRVLLRRPQSIETSTTEQNLQVADLELDIENQVAYRGGQLTRVRSQKLTHP